MYHHGEKMAVLLIGASEGHMVGEWIAVLLAPRSELPTADLNAAYMTSSYSSIRIVLGCGLPDIITSATRVPMWYLPHTRTSATIHASLSAAVYHSEVTTYYEVPHVVHGKPLR